jgi:hypothetical protein
MATRTTNNATPKGIWLFFFFRLLERGERLMLPSPEGVVVSGFTSLKIV